MDTLNLTFLNLLFPLAFAGLLSGIRQLLKSFQRKSFRLSPYEKQVCVYTTIFWVLIVATLEIYILASASALPEVAFQRWEIILKVEPPILIGTLGLAIFTAIILPPRET